MNLKNRSAARKRAEKSIASLVRPCSQGFRAEGGGVGGVSVCWGEGVWEEEGHLCIGVRASVYRG